MRWAITHIPSSIGEPDHPERRHAGTLLQRAGRTRWQRFCRTWAHGACIGCWNGFEGWALYGMSGRLHVLQPRAGGASESNRDRTQGQRVNVREGR